MQRTDLLRLPIPKPASKDDILPPRSSELVISVNDVAPFIHVDHGIEQLPPAFSPAYGPLPSGFFSIGDTPFKMNVLAINPPFPRGIKIAYKVWWENLRSWGLTGPQKFSRDVTITLGIKIEDTTEFSGELGLTAKLSDAVALSVKLTSTVKHDVTITQENTQAEHFSLDVPDGSVYIYTIWQLVESFEIVDSGGNPVNWTGWISMELDMIAGRTAARAVHGRLRNAITNRTQTFFADPVPFKV